MTSVHSPLGFSLAGAILLVLAAATPAAGQAAPHEEVDEFPNHALVCPDGGYMSGCDDETIERAVRVEDAEPADFAKRCLYETEAACRVVSSGRIDAFGSVPDLYWQVLHLQAADGPRTEMLVLAEHQATFFYLLSARQVDGHLDTPIAVHGADDGENSRFILHIPAVNRALGNADLLFFTSGEGWNWIDAASLIQQADRLLPAGFSTASPVNFNFHEMTAFAPVSRDGDAACCATGGVVVLDFEQSDHSLAVSAVTFTESKSVEAAWTAHAETNGDALSGDNE